MAVYPKGRQWQANFMVSGTRYRREFPSEAEAAAWELQTRAALKLGRELPEAKPRSVGGVDAGTIGQVLRSTERLHWRTLKNSTRTALNAEVFVNWIGDKVPAVEALTTDNVQRFVEYLLDERNVSNATVNRYLSAISTLAKFAKLPAKLDIKHLWRKEGQGRIRFLSKEEEERILQTWTLWSKSLEKDFLVFLIDVGARPFSEGTTLEWRDVGNRKVTFWDTKNGTSRTIPTTTRVWEAIQRQRDNGLAGPFAGIDRWAMERLYDRTRTHLGLHDTVLYTARHTCCSRLVMNGADLRRVMEWMGHKNIVTTMRYAHLAPTALMDIAHLLEEGGGPKLRSVT